MTACETSDVLQEIHNQQVGWRTIPLRSAHTEEAELEFPPFVKKNAGKRNLKGTSVALRLQL